MLLLNLSEIIILQPPKGISGVIIVDHLAYLRWIIPKVPHPAGVMVGLVVMSVGLVAEPGGEQGEEFADIS